MIDFLSLIEAYGYFGVLISSFIGSASIILPLPSAAIIFASGGFFDPLFVGIIAGVGSGLGEIFGYLLGLGGRKIIDKRLKKGVKKWEKSFEKHGGFFIIFIFAATPLPDDFVGIAAGVLKYPFKKFLIAVIAGKIILSLILAYSGFYGLGWVLNYF